MSKREEFEERLQRGGVEKFAISILLKGYDSGHADGLLKGEELRTELVKALKYFINNKAHAITCEVTFCNDYGHDSLSIKGPKCNCSWPKYRALIARAEGGA